MKTRAVLSTSMLWLLALSITSCTVSEDLLTYGQLMPDYWEVAVSDDPNTCISVNGNYLTYGMGQLKEGANLTQTRLDATLGHAFPSKRIPEKVSILVQQDLSMLNIQFGNPIDREFSITTDCSNGWFRSEIVKKDEYLGDGVNLEHSVRKLELRKSVEGDLIVHLIVEIQSSSFLLFKSRDTLETWSRYEPYKAK